MGKMFQGHGNPQRYWVYTSDKFRSTFSGCPIPCTQSHYEMEYENKQPEFGSFQQKSYQYKATI